MFFQNLTNLFIYCTIILGEIMIQREEYLNILKNFKDQNLIKVLTGIRRCGKSTLFKLFIEYLKEIGISNEHIIVINLEDPTYNFKDYMEIYDYVDKQLKNNKK